MNEPSDKKILVWEMYPSIQGESTWAGLPCFFIRLSGCPLRCLWCDTEYAFYGGERKAISEVVEAAVGSGIPLVEVTGGEPMAQPNCPVLCQALLDRGLTVLIETAGSEPIETLPEGVIRIMDLKCPDSGEMNKNLWSNLEHLNKRDEVKFVIATEKDFDWAAEVVLREKLDELVKAVLFSPVFGQIDPQKMVAWILERKLPVRFQLQMHKFIWEPEARGV
ncbi:MAG: radical SAM protein [Candidatus Omnitrophica bacterium]|nr:radical SAM protein [Candidatus Omnitrophota bacterium]